MVVALPIVSHDSNTLTMLFNSDNFACATAKAKLTASGKPSGIATTKIVTAVTNNCTIFNGSSAGSNTLQNGGSSPEPTSGTLGSAGFNLTLNG